MILGIDTVVILLVVMGVACGFGGYAIAIAAQRRAGDGKTAAELKTEISDYKESVSEHFQTTAGLLHDMTEQYRSVYEHMAAGAQQLCDAEQATTQIESLRAGLLPVISKPVERDEAADLSTEGESEHEHEVSLEPTDLAAGEDPDSNVSATEPESSEELSALSEEQPDVGGELGGSAEISAESEGPEVSDGGDGANADVEAPSEDLTSKDKTQD